LYGSAKDFGNYSNEVREASLRQSFSDNLGRPYKKLFFLYGSAKDFGSFKDFVASRTYKLFESSSVPEAFFSKEQEVFLVQEKRLLRT
jgi:hypothetical protein